MIWERKHTGLPRPILQQLILVWRKYKGDLSCVWGWGWVEVSWDSASYNSNSKSLLGWNPSSVSWEIDSSLMVTLITCLVSQGKESKCTLPSSVSEGRAIRCYCCFLGGRTRIWILLASGPLHIWLLPPGKHILSFLLSPWWFLHFLQREGHGFILLDTPALTQVLDGSLRFTCVAIMELTSISCSISVFPLNSEFPGGKDLIYPFCYYAIRV